MKRALLAGTIAAVGCLGFAMAQGVNTVPQVGLVTSLLKQLTYSAAAIGLPAPVAPTDVFCINGSTSKNIHITRIEVAALGNPGNIPVVLKLNHSLDTGGTAMAGINAPVAWPMNPSDVASTSTVTAYAANPTITDAAPAFIRGGIVSVLPALSGGAPGPQVNWRFGASTDWFDKGFDIIKASTVVQQVCVNMSGATVSGAPALMISAEWTEIP